MGLDSRNSRLATETHKIRDWPSGSGLASAMSDFQDKLGGILHYLTLIAIGLGVILAIIIGVAIYFYRKNKKSEILR
jgi:hypothetical protein